MTLEKLLNVFYVARMFNALNKPVYPSTPTIRRAAKAAQAIGLSISSIELELDGRIRVIGASKNPSQSVDEFDMLDQAGAL